MKQDQPESKNTFCYDVFHDVLDSVTEDFNIYEEGDRLTSPLSIDLDILTRKLDEEDEILLELKRLLKEIKAFEQALDESSDKFDLTFEQALESSDKFDLTFEKSLEKLEEIYDRKDYKYDTTT